MNIIVIVLCPFRKSEHKFYVEGRQMWKLNHKNEIIKNWEATITTFTLLSITWNCNRNGVSLLNYHSYFTLWMLVDVAVYAQNLWTLDTFCCKLERDFDLTAMELQHAFIFSRKGHFLFYFQKSFIFHLISDFIVFLN